MTDKTSTIESLTIRLQQLGAPLLVLLVAAGIAAAVWYYRTTRPRPEGYLRPLLVALRASALALLLIGLAEPVISLVRTISRRGTVTVLVDTSGSMENSPGGARGEMLDAVGRIRSSLGDAVRVYAFDTDVREWEGDPEFDGPATDIMGAVESALRVGKEPSAIVLVSDGRWNLGRDPAGAALSVEVPVHTIFAGDGEEADVALRSVSAADIGHAGDSLMVEVEIGARGDAAGPVPVTLSENGTQLAAVTVNLDSAATARVRLPLPLDSPGDHRYTAAIAPARDTRSENNSREFTVQVLKSTFSILLSSPAPSPDLAFMRRAIERDGAFALTLDVGLPGGASLSPAEASDTLDAVIVLDGGGPSVRDNAAEIARRVRGGTGICFAGSTPPEGALTPLIGDMPFTFTDSVNAPEAGVLMQLTEAGRGHFITGTRTGIDIASWSGLPPLPSILRVTADAPGSALLAETLPVGPDDAELPAVITGVLGGGKILVIPCSGLWRWRLRMAGADRSETVFDSFVTGSLRWLTTQADTDPLRVTTGSSLYPGGAEIDFEGRLFDNVLTPRSGADIVVTVDDNPARRLFLQETAPGRYTGELEGLPPGGHSFHAEARLGNRLIAETEGTFTVEDVSLDMLDAAADPGLMRSIAERTCGLSVTPAGVDSLLSAMSPSYSSERRESSHYPYLHPAFPLIAILLLAVEWGIRKRQGMI